MCVQGSHGAECGLSIKGMSMASNYQASGSLGGLHGSVSDSTEQSQGTWRCGEQTTTSVLAMARPTARGGSYVWIWLCCQGRQGTTVYHHPGPFLVETTPACTECDHIRCGRCEVRQEWVPDDVV